MQTTYFSKISAVFCLALIFGCATSQVVPPNPAEQARAEIALGAELAQRLESQLRIAQDPEITIYLRNVARKLLLSTPGGADAAIGVLVIRDREGPWRNFSLPGNRIYLSVGFLKTLKYEHELAAALALELAHISRKHLLQRVQEIYGSERTAVSMEPPRTVDYFSPAGAFNFPEAAHIHAVEDAFQTLYRTGFDPRGLPALFSIYRKNAAKSALEDSTVEKLLSASRQVIAKTAPLRNPILRTREFLKFKKRIKRL